MLRSTKWKLFFFLGFQRGMQQSPVKFNTQLKLKNNLTCPLSLILSQNFHKRHRPSRAINKRILLVLAEASVVRLLNKNLAGISRTYSVRLWRSDFSRKILPNRSNKLAAVRFLADSPLVHYVRCCIREALGKIIFRYGASSALHYNTPYKGPSLAASKNKDRKITRIKS